MAVMKRKAAEVSSVPVVEKKCRRKVVAVKTKPKPVGFGYRDKWRRKVGAVKSKPQPVSFGSGDKWVRGDKIGEGGFGSVFVAFFDSCYVDLLQLPRVMAIKSAKLKEAESIKYELDVYEELNGGSCPFLIGHHGEELTLSSEGETVYNLILEIAWGSLAKYINVSDTGLPECEVRRYAGEILQGLKHIHDGGFVHCDLKPDNILLVESVDDDGRPMLTAKVGDLGLAKKEVYEGGWRGTPSYLPPETIYQNKQEMPSDIWALGLIVLEMLTGERPRHILYESETGYFCIVERMQPEIPDTISPLARDFIGWCLEEVPEHRFTAEELLCHEFVAEVMS